MENDVIFAGRRDRGHKEKETIQREAFIAGIESMLTEMQDGSSAMVHRDENITVIDSKDEFYAYFTPERGQRQAACAHSRRVRDDALRRRRSRGTDQEGPRGDGALHPHRRPGSRPDEPGTRPHRQAQCRAWSGRRATESPSNAREGAPPDFH